MFRDKPSRKPRQRIETLPTYTIPEAAQMLAIEPRTLLSWYSGPEPVLRPSGALGAVRLLSFGDLEEAYRVHLLRSSHEVTMQRLRRAMTNARRMFRTAHPLRRPGAVQQCLGDLIYCQPARRGRPARATSIALRPGQAYVPEVAELFRRRIEGGKFIYPWRYAVGDAQSRPVSISPAVMSGRLVVTGTRLPAIAVAGMYEEGKPVDEIADEYGIEPLVVSQVLDHLKLRPKAA